MGKDTNYQVVYRGETLPHYIPGEWVFFQRPIECGGGFWLGKTFDGLFMLEMDRHVSLHDGLCYIVQHTNVSENFMDFDDDFTLT